MAVAVDVGSWLLLAERGVFGTPLARVSVLVAVPLHFVLGAYLVSAAARDMSHAGPRGAHRA